MKQVLVVVALLAALTPRLAFAADCQFTLGFATMAGAVPQVGQCKENEHDDGQGNRVQATTTGLLVWRKGDNWTAFTDGYRTWVNGAAGIAQRLNTERFTWESAGPGVLDNGQRVASSYIWAGYSASLTPTVVSGNWTVPDATKGWGSDGTWVGVDSPEALLQAGTDNSYHAAWVELWPAKAVYLQPDVIRAQPGDSFTVEIRKSPGGDWKLSLTNNTSGQSYQTAMSLPGTPRRAACIDEVTAHDSLVKAPYPSYGSVTFSFCKINDSPMILSLNPIRYNRVDVSGPGRSSPSALNPDGRGGFTITQTTS